ncbi:MAG: TIGR03087 family PEP-CTERM/XrtA system glycosyltransferase [Stellaceae bacterium]
MDPILFLTQRIPFPPNKGDKIRSWHILKYLAQSHRVFLGCFLDDPLDRDHLAALGEICAGVACFPISPWSRRLRALLRVRWGKPLTLDYFSDARLSAWIDDTVSRHGIRRAFVFSSSMAPYAIPLHGRRILDLVDLDSAKWREYARHRPWPLSLVFSREARTLGAFEQRAATAFDQTLFVSEAEADEFRRLNPDERMKVTAMPNGVDLIYFSPDKSRPDPFEPGGCRLVFTGAMDYWPNIDAVTWFAEEILPGLRAAGMPARFYIVGSRPSRAVRSLGRLPHVTVTGRVADVRPFLAHAFAAVAPLRVARGIQNKVLEAMAMGTPVVASTAACCGIAAQPGADLTIAESAADWISQLSSMSEGDRSRLGKAGRSFVERHHRWDRNLHMLDRWLPPRSAPVNLT